MLTVATLPEKQNNKFESIIKTNKGEIFPPAGDITAISAAMALKKLNSRSEKGEESAPIGIA